MFMGKVLQVKDLETRFQTKNGILHAVNGVSINLARGETLGIVGESGCGKSVTMMSILRLIPQPPGQLVNGSAIFHGSDLLKISDEELRKIRGSKISLVFQDPMTSFNPILPIGLQMAEPLLYHNGMSYRETEQYVLDILARVGIPKAKDRINNFPFQFSGGMRQRVMIATALICKPEILIADEPTTALDVTIQAQIIELVKELRDEFGMSIIWITHDLGVIAGLVDRVLVMYAGYIIEDALVDELYKNPRHPYTRGLLGSLPKIIGTNRKRLDSIEGIPPILYAKPNYCPFVTRCNRAVSICKEANPALEEKSNHHFVACWVTD
jgi:oligopeptide transport system ATP-binding protein